MWVPSVAMLVDGLVVSVALTTLVILLHLPGLKLCAVRVDALTSRFEVIEVGCGLKGMAPWPTATL